MKLLAFKKHKTLDSAPTVIKVEVVDSDEGEILILNPMGGLPEKHKIKKSGEFSDSYFGMRAVITNYGDSILKVSTNYQD
ncbi:hypothetical protein DICPUDRAFT_157616 [Dictyostelium purpureum]|uniref:Uncharacterized protein n=1 Tax=Dictyostelium purpureum TaxID=5786 RepID=F0ZZL4_DICPU|nr:uncharacterized protein DICPUDRAFT_157616 [Dictyostelium purpureum]EGC30615.1 hypothetical protein DICPUDRAFT_157616 [Dictyostelium purpureum]|eukprot:XP_003292850.1 hypothetical protein DICPUDRAFT_157616 [Dictyostelium purpureum]